MKSESNEQIPDKHQTCTGISGDRLGIVETVRQFNAVWEPEGLGIPADKFAKRESGYNDKDGLIGRGFYFGDADGDEFLEYYISGRFGGEIHERRYASGRRDVLETVTGPYGV